MLNYQVKIGLVPIRRDCCPRPGMFNWEYAEERGKKIVGYIEGHYGSENVSFADLKGVIDVETLYSENDIGKVVAHFRAEKVDALLIINTNFGNEEAAAMLAQEMNVPTMLWAPLDDVFEADGLRHTDSQCGLFGTSRQFQRYNLPFTFVKNCRVEDEALAKGIDRFARVACMVKNFRGMRIGEVGMRPKPFCSVIFNEGELMQRFGLHIIPVNMAVIADKFNRILAERDAELVEGAALLNSMYEVDDKTAPLLKRIYAFVLLFKDLFQEFNLSAISSECWTAMGLACGALPCSAYGILLDQGYIVSCESDMHCAITMAMLSCASLGKNPPFLGEFTVRHPSDNNVELLWHCGPFPYSIRKPGCKPREVEQRQWFEVKHSTYTVARIDQDNGKYLFLNGVCKSTEGPFTNGTYLWARFDNLDNWERKLMEGPYIHHMAEVEGDYTEVIRDFCKYVPNLTIDTVA